jgi:outer membrane receptor protein involved in Fe transport
MKRSASRYGILGLILLACAGTGAYAQETRGGIEGVVKDSTGAVLPGATVEARSPALVGVASATTDGSGGYRFPALAPGVYEVTASLSGFQTSKFEKVDLRLGQILKIDFAMPVSGVSESVQVSAESPIIDVKQNAAAVSIDAELIDRMPKGRDFLSVITTAPGTTSELKAGGLQVDGASGSENRFVVDGLDTTSLRTGVNQKNLLVDFVQEVQVKSSGYNAEYRATTGGVVSAITKSGSNSIRGDVNVYYDNDKWLGAVRPTLRLVPTDNSKAEYITTPRNDAYQADMALDVGGPILRDRAWFFVGYAPQTHSESRTVTFTSNNQKGTFDADTDAFDLNYNVTSQVMKNLRVKVAASNQRANGMNRTLPGIEANGTSTSNPALFPNPFSNRTTNDSYVGDIAWVVTPKFFVNANVGTLGYNTIQETDTQFSTALVHSFSQPNTCTPSSCPFPQIPSNLQQLSGYSDNPSSTHNFQDKYGRVGVNTDATYYGHFWGQHTLKGGVQWERLSNDVLTGAAAPTVSLVWNSSRTTLDDPPRVVRGQYGYYTVARRYTEGAIHSNNVGLFIQDSWTLNNRLTLNLGLRGDHEDVPSYRPENPGITFGFADKLAPRVGFAYDVKGDARWKTYGSWGQFYDIMKLEMPRGSWGADHWIDYHYTLDTFDWPSINCSGEPGSGCPGTFIEQADRRHVANDPNNFLVDPNLKPVRTQELTFGTDHELNRTMSLGVRYSHKWLDRTIEDVGLQVAGVGEVFKIANPGYGIAEYSIAATCPSCPAQPKAKRDYDGVEFRLRKRLSNRWSLNTSYLWSRLYGNYGGLASSDEDGRTSPNVDRAFDGLYMSFDETGQPVYGPLQTDRPHTFKALATYELPFGLGTAVDYFIATGTPQQSTVTYKSVPVFYHGRNDLGRTPTYSYTNLSLYHDFRIGGARSLGLSLNVLNLFDQDTVVTLSAARWRDPLAGVDDAGFFRGFDTEALATAGKLRTDPRYGQASAYQRPRQVRVEARFRF